MTTFPCRLGRTGGVISAVLLVPILWFSYEKSKAVVGYEGQVVAVSNPPAALDQRVTVKIPEIGTVYFPAEMGADEINKECVRLCESGTLPPAPAGSQATYEFTRSEVRRVNKGRFIGLSALGLAACALLIQGAMWLTARASREPKEPTT